MAKSKKEKDAKFEEFTATLKGFSATQRASILDILHDNHEEESDEDADDDDEDENEENQ